MNNTNMAEVEFEHPYYIYCLDDFYGDRSLKIMRLLGYSFMKITIGKIFVCTYET
jgi:hypothetical protein